MSTTMDHVGEQASNAEAIITAVERLTGNSMLGVARPDNDEALVAVLPEGKRLESVKKYLDEFASAPERIVGSATLQDEASFVAHVESFKRPTTAIYCEPSFERPALTAVYDYHAVAEDAVQPAFCQHRAVWPLKLSKEWSAWAGGAGKWMTHADFAEFLERHVPDVYWGDELSEYSKLLIQTLDLSRATPSQLVALSRNLSVNVDVAVKSAQTLSSGEIALAYVENHRDDEGKPIKVPNAFFIAIPVVQHGPAYQILARLRYRVANQRISWAYELHRVDIVFDAAVREIQTRVAEATGCPVYLGAPEK